jgi:hypothetical protein
MEPIKIIKSDMFNINISKEYKIYLLNSKELEKKEIFFREFMNNFNKKLENSSKKLYICIDCEFNSKKIALIQINFEEEEDGNIFIIDPKILSTLTLNVLKDKILCNNKIGKIFHGADSLDIPYFFYEFFNSDKKQIVKFMETFVDTRFLCEYSNAYDKLYNKIDSNLCNIYYLLEKYLVINKEQHKYLDENEEKMGKLFDILIEIDTLSEELIIYSAYDVIYLKYLYKRMISSIKEYRYVNEMIRLVYLDKRDIIKFIDKEIIDKYNTNFYFKDGKMIRLNDLIESNKVFQNKIFNTLYHINYFKLNLNMILKNIIYSKLLRRERVFINKNTIQKTQLLYSTLFDKLRLYKLENILSLIENLET